LSNRPRKPRSSRLNRSEEDQWLEFVRHARQSLVPKLRQSAYVMSLLPDRDGVDVKFAVEIGLAMMLDKPMFVVVRPGFHVPERLRRAADEVFEMAADPDTEEGQQEVADAFNEFIERWQQ
jgi:hypothetical protein